MVEVSATHRDDAFNGVAGGDRPLRTVDRTQPTISATRRAKSDPATIGAKSTTRANANRAKGNRTATDRATTDRITVFGLPLTRVTSLNDAEALIGDHLARRPPAPVLVTFANPLGVKLVASDAVYGANLRRMNLVFCDGIGLAWAARRIACCPMARISFDSTSLAPSVFAIAEERRHSVALVGGRPGVAEVADGRIRENFPTLRIVAAIDGYRPDADLIRDLVERDPDIVVCGMGAPRQEAFLAALADAGWSGIGFTCGGYLDQLGERFDFYPALVNRLNLRWLYRLAREPKRMGSRYAIDYAPFWRSIARELVRTVLPTHRYSRRS